MISQALGGSITLRSASGLFRVAFEDAAPLGPEVVTALREAHGDSGDAPEEYSEDAVWDALRQCFDPEIPINIVDLGLIYSLSSHEVEDGRHHIDVKMTLTATGCGMGPTIAADARSKIEQLPFVESAEVDIVWDPQWTPQMISAEGRKILGLD